jgi:chaperone BCS1
MLNSIGSNENKILLFEDIDSAFSKKEVVKFENKITSDRKIDVDSGDSKDQNNKKEEKEEEVVSVNKKYLTYSGLLNALDGTLSNHHGVITIMTTNYLEKLGDAFLRPGRIDRKFELKECNHEQLKKMMSTIIGKSIKLMDLKNVDENKLKENIESFVAKIVDKDGNSKIKPCEMQRYILKHIENLDMMFENHGDLLL